MTPWKESKSAQMPYGELLTPHLGNGLVVWEHNTGVNAGVLVYFKDPECFALLEWVFPDCPCERCDPWNHLSKGELYHEIAKSIRWFTPHQWPTPKPPEEEKDLRAKEEEIIRTLYKFLTPLIEASEREDA